MDDDPSSESTLRLSVLAKIDVGAAGLTAKVISEPPAVFLINVLRLALLAASWRMSQMSSGIVSAPPVSVRRALGSLLTTVKVPDPGLVVV